MKPYKYLLDTCTCVFLMRGKYNIDKIISRVGIEKCCISEITVAELLFGALWSGDPQNVKLTKLFCKSLYVEPITDTIEEYARQKTRLRKSGLTIDDFDLLIGCCAIQHGLTLVTDNIKHFKRLPIEIENWVKRE